MLFWNKIEYIGILSYPVLFLLFALQYVGLDDRFPRRTLALLFLLPAVILLAKFFDDRLQWIYVAPHVNASGAISLLNFGRGPMYIPISLYSLVMITLGNALLIRKWRSASALYRRQTAIMLTAALFLYATCAVYASGIDLIPELPQLDFNPFLYSVWGLAIGIAIFRYRLFELTPVARDALIELLEDAVIVLDAQTRVVDANPEARRIFGWNRVPIGRAAEPALYGWVDSVFLESVSATARKEVRLDEDGGTDYDLTVTALRDRRKQVVGFLLLAHDISIRKDYERRLHELSLADELTGLNNRRGFSLLAGQMLGMAERAKMNAVVLYIDLDRLKGINDTLGHAAGDRALIETADLLRRAFRTSDITARLGGDEFGVLAAESADNSADAMRTRLESLVAEWNARPGREYALSFSIGTARFRWKNPVSLDILLEQADRLMYRYKQAKQDAPQP
jgi:diguanylate cyclase (GGDEF)-like protein/PAS domain S-box-containing protein